MLSASTSAKPRSLHSTFGPVSITFEFLEHTANKLKSYTLKFRQKKRRTL